MKIFFLNTSPYSLKNPPKSTDFYREEEEEIEGKRKDRDVTVNSTYCSLGTFPRQTLYWLSI